MCVDAEFDSVARSNYDYLTLIVRRYIHSEDDVLDVVQETLYRAYKSWGNFQGDSDVRTWLTRVAINTAIDWLRKQHGKGKGQRPTVRSLDDVISTEDESIRLRDTLVADREVSDPYYIVSQQEITQQKRQVVYDVIDGLSPKLADVLRAELMFSGDTGALHANIAEQLQLPVGTVKSRLHRAREEFKKRIEPVISVIEG